VLAIFINSSINIGTNPDTGKFAIWISTSDATVMQNIQVSINEGLLPDVYVKEQQIENPEQYTWGSKKIYNFFHELFHETSSLKFFGADSGILNFRMLRMMVFLNIFIIVGAIYLRKKFAFIPSKVQIVCELAYEFFDKLVVDSLGEQRKRFIPFFMSLFIVIWLSNWVSLLPIPGITEPTSNLNFPLALGFMSIMIVHYNSFRKKGAKEYTKGFLEPLFVMAPLNVVGELSKMVSVSFRLFGNIFGGAIIFIVISNLVFHVVLPVGLTMFFTMFAGTIQAFVFTMLTLSYLSLEVNEA